MTSTLFCGQFSRIISKPYRYIANICPYTIPCAPCDVFCHVPGAWWVLIWWVLAIRCWLGGCLQPDVVPKLGRQAYGQTGSGKTHTIEGSYHEFKNRGLCVPPTRTTRRNRRSRIVGCAGHLSICPSAHLSWWALPGVYGSTGLQVYTLCLTT